MDRPTEEALCDLQAQVSVLRMALRALIRMHPDPDACLAAWRMTIADAASGPAVLPLYMRGSDYVNERCGVFAEDWTAELVEQAIACKAK
jgi:hypothetical protein